MPRRLAGGRSCIRPLTPTPGKMPGSGESPCTTSQDAINVRFPSVPDRTPLWSPTSRPALSRTSPSTASTQISTLYEVTADGQGA